MRDEEAEELYQSWIDASKKIDRLTAENAQLRAELAAMRDANRWIPVGERLPEVARHVSNYFQVATKNPTNGYKAVDEACYVPEDWTVDDGFTYKAGWYRHNTVTPIIGIDITHWRPLPAPPEAE